MVLDTKLQNRQILTSLENDIFSPYIVIIAGSRRVGKTSLLHLIQNKILESNHDKGNILYFDLENPIFLETFQIKDYDLLANNLISQAKNKNMKNPTVPAGLKSFINYYSPTTAIIATKNLYTVSKLGNTRIIWIPIYLF